MEEKVYEEHNHSQCIGSALDQAAKLCKEKDVRFTAIRKQVLKLIWQSHKPVGAYELLPQLEKAGFNSAPPTVYRALEFLLDMNLIHRINSLNAFVGCSHPEQSHSSCFFICQSCGVAQELHSDPLTQMSRKLEKELGIKVNENVAEFSGICPPCQSEH